MRRTQGLKLNHNVSYRRGNFERIFPTRSNWQNYARFFECDRYNDCLVWKYLAASSDVLEKHRCAVEQIRMLNIAGRK